MGYHAFDPRGLIAEAYRIEGITAPECRAIFFDWALSRPDGGEAHEIAALLEAYGADGQDHPMSEVLREGLTGAARPTGRRGGWRARRK
jgi:hypothetical protein